jgi:GntR family transcriptional regulator, transcriptional repressor for pyruvate dehydrogenase complex
LEVNQFDRRLLSKEITNDIKNLIINKQLKPGDKLPNENELAQMMGVSRPTLREAIKTLASSNIVVVKRGCGTYVSQKPGLVDDPLGVNFMSDKNLLLSLFEARILIEPGVAYLAAERATASDMKKIKVCIDKMYEEVKGKKAYRDEDLDFHKAIAGATKNPIIQRIVPIINESIIQGYVETVNVPGSVEKAILSHEKIYSAIKDKNPSQAEIEMKRHLVETINDIKLNL